MLTVKTRYLGVVTAITSVLIVAFIQPHYVHNEDGYVRLFGPGPNETFIPGWVIPCITGFTTYTALVIMESL